MANAGTTPAFSMLWVGQLHACNTLLSLSLSCFLFHSKYFLWIEWWAGVSKRAWRIWFSSRVKGTKSFFSSGFIFGDGFEIQTTFGTFGLNGNGNRIIIRLIKILLKLIYARVSCCKNACVFCYSICYNWTKDQFWDADTLNFSNNRSYYFQIV